MKPSRRWIARVLSGGLALSIASLSLTGCAAGIKAGDGKLTMVGSVTGKTATDLQNELNAWSADSGVEITYQPLPDFANAIKPLLQSNDKPDLVLFPQPAAIMQLGSKLRPIGLQKLANLKPVLKSLVPGFDVLTASKGSIYGLPITTSLKSMVWYNPAAFAKYGYQPPTSDIQLLDLVKKMRNDGHGAPWCAGTENGALTGETVGDWLEAYTLKYAGLARYTKWWQGAYSFTSDLINTAGNRVADELLTPGNVNGGGEAIVNTYFGPATARGLFEQSASKGQCFMFMSGDYSPAFFPKDVQTEIAAGNFAHAAVFPLPDTVKGHRSVVGTAQLVTAFHDDSDVRVALEFLLSNKVGTYSWAKAGTFLSPHASFDNTIYRNQLRKQIAEIMANATDFGFDASDLMPSVVGQGAEPAQLTQWMSGNVSLSQALTNIEAAWPAGE